MTREQAERWVERHQARVYSFTGKDGERWDLALWWADKGRQRTHVVGTSYEHAVELAQADIAKRTSDDKLSRLAKPQCMSTGCASDAVIRTSVAHYRIDLCSECMRWLLERLLRDFHGASAANLWFEIARHKTLQ